MHSISCVAPGDGPVGSAAGAGIAAAILLAHPGIDREEVMPAENSEKSLGRVGSEAVLGLDRDANVLRGDSAALPFSEIELSARDAPSQPRE